MSAQECRRCDSTNDTTSRSLCADCIAQVGYLGDWLVRKLDETEDMLHGRDNDVQRLLNDKERVELELVRVRQLLAHAVLRHDYVCAELAEIKPDASNPDDRLMKQARAAASVRA